MTLDARLRTLIAGAWARGAATYDLDIGHGALTPRLHAYWLALLRRLAGAEPLDCIDVGTGTGFLAVLLAELGHRVRGFDLSPEMLAYARRRAERASVTVAFAEGEATALPLPDNAADLVASRHVLWTMPEPRLAIAEWVRVTRPGGRVLWFDWLAPRDGTGQRFRERASALVRRLQRAETPHEDHGYPEEAYAALPLRHVTDIQLIRGFLLGLGIADATVRLLPELARLERAELPFYRRIAETSSRYCVTFTVTNPLKQQFAVLRASVPA
jgi:ubiquinone/menaquinone biosynthesis C-methylase UbiE